MRIDSAAFGLDKLGLRMSVVKVVLGYVRILARDVCLRDWKDGLGLAFMLEWVTT